MLRLEDYILAAENSEGKKQRRLFKKKRSTEVLTREQVKAIKKGRKLLRKQMKAQGLKDKQDFELTAASFGLYFDKSRFAALIPLWGRWGCLPWALLGALALLLLVLWLFSWITTLQGHFTVSLADDLFREGFVLSETEDFANPTTHLFATPAEGVPCISIKDIPEDVDEYEGNHNAQYFAYTFWCRNEGESTVDYSWELKLNSESKALSDAAWVMLFQDGEMLFYAEEGDDGGPEALPAFDDNTRGYLDLKMMDLNADPRDQYQLITQRGELAYYRIIPIPFESDTVVTTGIETSVEPMEVHKYTVVIWLEGDDPDCTDDMIGGHVGMQFDIELLEEEE